MSKIADADNLRLAFWKAAKGKRGKADCLAFRVRLDEALATLRDELLAGEVPVGDYHYFKVHDPKERLICAASFRERVLHHALMKVCKPVLDRAAVFDSYACRKGKGRLAAVERAQGYARTHRWFLKLEQQQPGQREQQHRVPFRSAPSSTRLPEGGGADPATIPSSQAVLRGKEPQPKGPVSVVESGSAKPPGLFFQNVRSTERTK